MIRIVIIMMQNNEWQWMDNNYYNIVLPWVVALLSCHIAGHVWKQGFLFYIPDGSTIYMQ